MSQVKRGTVAISSITEQFFVRQHLNNDHVNFLAGLYEAGAKLPPIIVSRNESILIEGRHRLAALRQLGKKSVDVEWTDVTDKGELLAMALSYNIGGALPPSNGDIIYSMQQMLESGMTNSQIIKHFSQAWPPAVVRRYVADAQSNLTKDRVVKAKQAVIEGNMSVGEAALLYKLKLDTLKNAMSGSRKKRSNTAEIKGALTGIFRSRGASMGQLMRKLQTRYEDGELSWKAIDDVLEHAEQCVKSTSNSVRDWRKRFESKAKVEVKKAS